MLKEKSQKPPLRPTMNSLHRMLDVLSLITPERPTVEAELICEELGYSLATAYRYMRELTSVGLLVRLPTGYALGPRVIELDLQIRESDPLLGHSRELIAQLVHQTGMSVLLSAFYGDTLITVHQEDGIDREALKFGRGRRMPLFRGATARIVLAHLPPRRLRKLFDANAGHPALQRLGADWRSFSKTLLQVRKQGYCLSRGELSPGRAGLAAPVFDDKHRVLGGITLVGGLPRFEAFNEQFLAQLVRDAAAEITRRIALTPLPPPADAEAVSQALRDTALPA